MNPAHPTRDVDTTAQGPTHFATRTSMRRTITIQRAAARRSMRPRAPEREGAPHRADGLRASQLFHIAAEEITWFFTSRDSGPSARLARSTIEGWLLTLEPAERRTLALRFDASPWADDIQDRGLTSGFALAVSLVTSARWHDKSGPRKGPHRRAGELLEVAIRERGLAVMRDLSRRADWDFTAALRAYAKARGRCPSVLVGRAA